jgi:hypothetical protein
MSTTEKLVGSFRTACLHPPHFRIVGKGSTRQGSHNRDPDRTVELEVEQVSVVEMSATTRPTAKTLPSDSKTCHARREPQDLEALNRTADRLRPLFRGGFTHSCTFGSHNRSARASFRELVILMSACLLGYQELKLSQELLSYVQRNATWKLRNKKLPAPELTRLGLTHLHLELPSPMFRYRSPRGPS